jgi:glycogen(starch) synthase
MKLLVYSHSFAPNVGGIETIVRSLTRGLAELRGADGKPQFELTLVTQTLAGRDSDDRLLMEFPVIRQPGILRLWKLIRAADVIHLAGPALLPLILARLAGKPVVIEHHGYQAICPNGLLVELPQRKICRGYFQARRYDKCVKCKAREMSWLQGFGSVLAMFPRNFLARRVARNIAISQHQLKRMALPSTLLIYHGVADVADPHPLFSGSANEGKICFAYVGRFVPEKGLGTLLEAAEQLKKQKLEFQLLLIGDGPERVKVEERITRSGLSDVVRCTGFLQGAAFAEVTKTVNVFLMPSSWEETAGLAAIEQMMRGRLVMAARIGGLGEIVGTAGITFEPERADDLANAIGDVLRDPKVIPTRGAKARERARELFIRERMIADHARLYGEIFPS